MATRCAWPPGELTDAALLHASQPHGAEPLGGMADGLVLRCAIEHEGQCRVLHGSELGDEHALLEDEPEGFTSQSGMVLGGEGLDVDGTSGQVQFDAAGIGGEDPRQAVQQGGLARARRSHDGDRLAGGDGEVDVVEGTGGAIGLRQRLGVQPGTWGDVGRGSVLARCRRHGIHCAARSRGAHRAGGRDCRHAAVGESSSSR